MRLVSLYRCQYTKWVGPVNVGALLLLFTGRLISLRGDVDWPARSPDLSPCDVFLWGYLKEKVFKHRPRSLEDLKESIQQEIDSILPELTRRVIKKFRERLHQCVANDGCLVSDLIFVINYKNCFYCTFQKYIQFFSRWNLSYFMPLRKVGDLYASSCILCIGWIIKCLIIIDELCKHEDMSILFLWTTNFERRCVCSPAV